MRVNYWNESTFWIWFMEAFKSNQIWHKELGFDSDESTHDWIQSQLTVRVNWRTDSESIQEQFSTDSRKIRNLLKSTFRVDSWNDSIYTHWEVVVNRFRVDRHTEGFEGLNVDSSYTQPRERFRFRVEQWEGFRDDSWRMSQMNTWFGADSWTDSESIHEIWMLTGVRE